MSLLKKITQSCLFLLPALFLLAISCTEKITLDPPEGKVLPVIEGTFSNEYKQHEITLCYSSDLYSSETEMINGAKIYVVISGSYQGPGDTIWYHEKPNAPGHYITDSVAGVKNRWYHLEVNVEENDLYDYTLHMYSDSKMPNNVDHIDSLGLLPLLNEQGIPFVDDDAAVRVCPYFQTLDNKDIVYSVELYLNGNRFKNRPSKLFDLFAMEGYAGYYFNGPEMLENNTEIPVGIMNKSYMHEGDIVKLKLISITKDYMYFLFNQKLAIGSNPVMGAFPANFSNIWSNCDAIGWFSTTAATECEGVFHDWEH